MSELGETRSKAAMASFDTPVITAPTGPCSFKFDPRNNAKLLEIHPHFELFLRPAGAPAEKKEVPTTKVSKHVSIPAPPPDPVKPPVQAKPAEKQVRTRIMPQMSFKPSTLQGPGGKVIPMRPFLDARQVKLRSKKKVKKQVKPAQPAQPIANNSAVFTNVETRHNTTRFEEASRAEEPKLEGQKAEYKKLYEEFCKLIPQKPFAQISRI